MALIQGDIEETGEVAVNEEVKLEIKYQQRNGRKGWTIISHFTEMGIDSSLRENFMKKVKKSRGCSASYDKDSDTVIFQGDHRDYIAAFIETELSLDSSRYIIS